MKFAHCPDCGSLLVPRDLGDERGVPWCEKCSVPWFPIFPVVAIVLVVNPRGELLLLRQNYISTEFRNLVSGYVLPGERAEECARREVREEVGLELSELRLEGTWWFSKKEMLMVGFTARSESTELKLSFEVDGADWVEPAKAATMVHQSEESVSRRLVRKWIADHAV